MGTRCPCISVSPEPLQGPPAIGQSAGHTAAERSPADGARQPAIGGGTRGLPPSDPRRSRAADGGRTHTKQLQPWASAAGEPRPPAGDVGRCSRGRKGSVGAALVTEPA